MYKHLLNKRFFRDNPVKELTAQKLIYSSILMPEIEELAKNYVHGLTDRAEDEALRIKEETNPEIILKMLRGKCDSINNTILRDKVLEYEEELVKRIIELLVRSGNDVFIEHAVSIIPKCKKSYLNNLMDILNEIRNPYTLSLVCIVIGHIGGEETIPVMHKKFLELKELYPKENYEQGLF